MTRNRSDRPNGGRIIHALAVSSTYTFHIRIKHVLVPHASFLREPPNDMPAFSTAVLSDKDAADMWAWLHSLPGRKPVKDFPLLNQ